MTPASAPFAPRRVLVTGAGGLLGHALVEGIRSAEPAVELDALSRAELDVEDPAAVAAWFRRSPPQAVVHAAAYTDVDGAEASPEACFRANALAAGTVARHAAAAGAAFVLVSTDFVFDGTKGAPYGEEDEPRPLGVYGRSKALGERLAREAHPRALVVRSQWLFGPDGEHFVGKILARARRGERLEVVDDQFGRPTYAPDLAAAIWALLRRDLSGIVHCANEGVTSWYDFARAILREAGLEADALAPSSAARLARPARRPAYAALASWRLEAEGGVRMRPWIEALRDYLRAEVGERAR